MRTELCVLLRQCFERHFLFSVKEGQVKIDTPVGKLPAYLREQVLEWKRELLLLFTTYPHEELPESFLQKPCSRCGLYDDARKTEEGMWVCACYYDLKYGLNPLHWRHILRKEELFAKERSA